MASPHSTNTDFYEFSASLEQALGGYAQRVIGICGVFGREKTRSLGHILVQDVAKRLDLTAVLVPITREDIVATPGVGELGDWDRIPLRSGRMNVWPNIPLDDSVNYQIDELLCLTWLRRRSKFAVMTFDTLEQVMNRVELIRRLDGLVIVNSGTDFESSVMSAACSQLRKHDVRLLGQVLRTESSI